MAIITISREFGSGGDAISQNVAESLGYLLVDKKLIDKVLTQYGVIYFDKIYESTHTLWERYESSNQELIEMLNRTLLAFSSLDNSVILGRGSYVLLSDYPNVLNVYIRAPFDQRVSNSMKTGEAKNYTDAENLVKYKDQCRKSFLQTFYNVDSNDSTFFHLIIDTDKIPPETATKWIIEAAEAIDKKELNVYQTTNAIEIDPVLSDTVAKVITEYKNQKADKNL